MDQTVPKTAKTAAPAREARDALQLKSEQHVEMRTYRDANNVNFQRVCADGEELSGGSAKDLRNAAKSLIKALELRKEYMERIGTPFPATTLNFVNGKYPDELRKLREKSRRSVETVYPLATPERWGGELPNFERTFQLRRGHGIVEVTDGFQIVPELQKYYVAREEFLEDYKWLNEISANGPLKTFCFKRLSFLKEHFSLHILLNEQLENDEQRAVSHRDFYNVRKVDTHIHAASAMNHKHLLRFIKKKMRTDVNEVVMKEKSGEKVTMGELFGKMGIRPYDLSVDMLDVQADKDTFHRFDRFNTKYNPIGRNELREIFIKTDNYVNGNYFGQLMKEVFADLKENKYQQMEPRISIYGRSEGEWTKLARWAVTNDLSSQNVSWVIQVPRLFDIYCAKQDLKTFDQFLDNVFTPLFEVTNDPNSHPELHRFLQHVSAFDSVDDESKTEDVAFSKDMPEPDEYNAEKNPPNPPYSYYLFYMYANLTALNAFRTMRRLNTFALKPHCGEAGSLNHLSASFLTSESIAHGLLLRKVPVLHYLFYLAQIGIAMSPISNNNLFLQYSRNPFPDYFKQGLNVSLSTDDPLQFHNTKEPLMEEYSIAGQMWNLNPCDKCELARNSVLQSGFEERLKLHWLGPNYKEEGVFGNDLSCTNVPDIRISYRHETLVNELINLYKARMLPK